MRIVIASLNPAIERLLVVEQNRPGAVHRLQRSETLAGGKGVNVARVIRQLESPLFRPFPGEEISVEPFLVGPLGGPTGRMQAGLLAAEALDGEYCEIEGWTRTNEVLIDESKPDAATVYNEAGPLLSGAEALKTHDLAVSSLDQAGMLICTGSLPPGLPPGFYGDWIAEAKSRGIPALLDAHGDALQLGAEQRPSIIKVNRDELNELAHQTGESPDAVISRWLNSGTESVIITDGTRPTQASTTDGTFTVQTPRVDTRSAVGSGDAFTAGLAWSLATKAGASWADHLALAAACGASNAAGILARLSTEEPPGRLLALVSTPRKENS